MQKTNAGVWKECMNTIVSFLLWEKKGNDLSTGRLTTDIQLSFLNAFVEKIFFVICSL